MKAMNKKKKQKFAKATDRVASLVGGEGKDPEEAIIKVAEENDYGRWMTENLARSFNVGVSWHQIEKSGSLEEKLMEAPVVRSDRLGDEVSDVDENNQTRKVAHMNELSGPQKDYIAEQNREESPLRKVASDIREDKTKDKPREKDLLKHYRKCAKLKEQIHLKMSSFGNRWENHMDRVADAVRSCDEPNHEILKRASVALPEYGDVYVAMLAEHMGDDGFAEELEKSGMKRFYMVDENQTPYCHMKEGAELLDEADQCDRAMQEVVEEMEKIADVTGYELPGHEGLYMRETEGPTDIVPAEDAANFQRDQASKIVDWIEAKKEREREQEADAKRRAQRGEAQVAPVGVTDLVRTNQDDYEGGGEETAVTRTDQGGDEDEHRVNVELVDEDPAQEAEVISDGLNLGIKDKAKGLADFAGKWWDDRAKGKPRGGQGEGRINRFVENLTETAKNLVEDEAGPVSLPASHEREINQLYSTAVLNRMLSSDPILSQRPEETIEMFNRVMEINPFVVRHPQVATSMTRRLVEASGRMDASEVSKLEESIGDSLKHLKPESKSRGSE